MNLIIYYYYYHYANILYNRNTTTIIELNIDLWPRCTKLHASPYTANA